MRSATVNGRAVLAAREGKGLTQDKLASVIRERLIAADPETDTTCSGSLISHIEAGRKQPSGQVFKAMVEVLGVPREQLLTDAGEAA